MVRPPQSFPASGAVALAALLAAGLAPAAQAQSLGYGDVSGAGAGYSDPASGDAGPQGEVYTPKKRGGKGKRGKTVSVTPYIEIDQVVTSQLSPGNETLTYTRAAAGVDASIAGRNNAASASIRYERQFGWGKRAQDGDVISGLVSGYTTITPGVTVEAGGLATRLHVDNGGSAVSDGLLGTGSSNIYSVYGGPSVRTKVGDLDVAAAYRAGFTKVERPNGYVATPGGASADVFDKSVTQVADVEVGVAPGVVLPVGLAVAGSGYQEDISNLDQRVRDLQGRGIVTVPVSRTVQVTGAIGYEDVEVSSRDAVYVNGVPVIGSDGRYVTDKSAPRKIAYETSGLIWDVGVMWRPSPRTGLSAHVGRRYGTTSVNGTFTWSPSERSTLSIGVYDNVAGFGGQLNRVIGALPTDFIAERDQLTGDVTTCVNSLDGSNCLGGALGSVRSSTFRARGITASYSRRVGRISAGIGAGYDRRKFIAADGTVLASANGVIDENTWLAAYVSGQLGRDAGWSANAHANWLSSSDPLVGSVNGYGATAAYYRELTRRLRATVAVGVDGLTRDDPVLDDIWTASALAGVRYSF